MIKRKNGKNIIFFLIVGAAAGFINGFLGTGGGIILLFGLILYDRFGGAPETSGLTRDRFAQTLAVMLVMSVVSAFFYGAKGYISLTVCGRYLLPAVAGGVIGAALLDKIKLNRLKKIFAVIVIWAGIVMVT